MNSISSPGGTPGTGYETAENAQSNTPHYAESRREHCGHHEHGSSPEPGHRSTLAADEDAVQRFEKAMTEPQKDACAPCALPQPFPLPGQLQTAPPVSGTGSAAPDWDTLLQRILVAEYDSQGTEVRLTLGDNVLPGTEIRLLRCGDGSLDVSLVTDNPASWQTLVAAQEDLRQRLERQSQGNVRVHVRSSAQADTDADSRRRSRGLVEMAPEAGER